MNRRNFLSRAGLLLGGGIVAGPEVLEAFARLTHKRRLWAGATFARPLGIEEQITRAFYDHKIRTGDYPTHIVAPPKTVMELASTLIEQRHPAPVMTFMGAKLTADPYAPHETVILRHVGPGETPTPTDWLQPAGKIYMQYTTERRLTTPHSL